LLFTIVGKHIDVTEALKEHARKKTSKLSKFYSSINQVEVIIDREQGGSSLSVEIIARGAHSKVFIKYFFKFVLIANESGGYQVTI